MTCNPRKVAELFAEATPPIPCPHCHGNGWIVLLPTFLPEGERERKGGENGSFTKTLCDHCQGRGRQAD